MKYLEKHPMYMVVLGVVGISLSAIIVKYSDAPSLITAVYRLLFTVMLLTPLVLGSREYRTELMSVSKKTVFLCAVSGIFLALHFTIWFESLNRTSVASSTVIVCTESIWVALLYFFLLKGQITRKAALSIIIAFFGSILVALSDYGKGKGHLDGDLLALFSAVMVAGYTLIGGIVRVNTSTTVYTFIVYFFCILSLVIAALFTSTPFLGYGLHSLGAGFLLAVFSTLLGHSIFSWCLKYMSPAFISTSKLCEPAVASLFAIFLFGEIPTLMQCIGGAVILGSVIVYSRTEQTQ